MVQASIWQFLTDQWTPAPPVETTDLSGKTVLVVGANTGIGYETAKHFAAMNPARLIMACRSQEKGAVAVTNLKESTGFDKAELWLVDLCSFASVQAFANKFEKEVERLDILVANAGVIPVKYEATEDDWETSIQVNHLAPALLIFLLLPQMFKAAELSSSEPRIVIVASMAHQEAKIPEKIFEAPSGLEELSSRAFCDPYVSQTKYNLAKLLNVVFTRALSEHLPPSQPTIIANSIHPGLCHSNLLNSSNYIMQLLLRLLARPAEEGARQVVWGAVATPDESQGGVDSLRGGYVSFSKVVEPGDFVVSEKGKAFQDILWSDTLKILSKVDPRVQPITERYLRK
ncbi:NAD(P)-binding domain superfamily protein [Pleurotus pulmonarius]|nr:hypothetical protein EYR38_001919 [Pleurotus pulmonarius]